MGVKNVIDIFMGDYVVVIVWGRFVEYGIFYWGGWVG